MPTYEYRCPACKKKFDLILSIGEHDAKKAKCPKCGGKKLDQIFTAFQVKTSKKSWFQLSFTEKQGEIPCFSAFSLRFQFQDTPVSYKSIISRRDSFLHSHQWHRRVDSELSCLIWGCWRKQKRGPVRGGTLTDPRIASTQLEVKQSGGMASCAGSSLNS